MSCVNIKEQFLSYLNFHPHQSSFYSIPAFMKSCNEALCQVQTLLVKVTQFETIISKNRLRNKQEQQSKMLHNLKQNIKICENHLKRIQIMQPDMKCSSDKFLQDYKSSIIATLEMKMLAIGIKFKQIYQKSRKSQYKNTKNQLENTNSSSKTDQQSAPNLKRPLFIDQTQQQLMQQVAINQYRQIQKSITKISKMYKQTAQMVRMHDYMIDSIESDINQTQVHVEGGKKNLTQAHRRQSKNRPFIIKVFITLYVVTGVYIVILS